MNLSGVPTWIAFAAASAAIAVLWLAHSARFPFAPCVVCGRSGARKSSRFRVWRNCPACGGGGKRRRVGRVLLDKHLGLVVVALATALGAVGGLAVQKIRPADASASGPVGVSAASAAEVRAEVGKARVAADSGQQGYSRARFPHWSRVAGQQCPSDVEVLRRDMTGETGTGCVVATGQLADSYTGKPVAYRRGGAAEVDVDHVVPLSLAWRRGASAWKQDRREQFANDPANLRAVASAANRSKGDKGLSEWLPVKGAQCSYVLAFLRVSNTYGLSVTQADKATAERVARTC